PGGAGQGRQADPLGRGVAGGTRGKVPPLRRGGIRSRTRRRDRLALDRAGLVPGRVGAVRTRRNLRRDDAPASPRRGAQPPRLPVLSGEERDPVKIYLGDEFSAKDFRTWGGTLLAAIYLAERAGKEGFP